MISITLILTLVTDTGNQEFLYTLPVDSGLTIGRDQSKAGELSNFLNLDSKVISRVHANVYVDNHSKVFIQDMKSSAGTFLNSMRLSPPKIQSTRFELMDGDYLQLGEDCIVNGAQFKCVLFRVTILMNEKESPRAKSRGSVDLRNVSRPESVVNQSEFEFNEIWKAINSATQDEYPAIYSIIEQIGNTLTAENK